MTEGAVDKAGLVWAGASRCGHCTSNGHSAYSEPLGTQPYGAHSLTLPLTLVASNRGPPGPSRGTLPRGMDMIMFMLTLMPMLVLVSTRSPTGSRLCSTLKRSVCLDSCKLLACASRHFPKDDDVTTPQATRGQS